MKTLPLLLKREYWEHRGGFLWTPLWVCAAILIVTVLGIISAEVFSAGSHVQMGFALDDLRKNMSAGDLAQAGNALDMAQVMFGAITCVSLFFVLFFYLLGALYDDRRDRSVLFWKSLPVTDTATVASKVLTAMFVAPAIAFAISTVAYAAFLVLVCLWAAVHGVNALPAVFASHPLGMFGRLLLTIPVDALWALPTIGWLLFWSATARSKPFLWAVILPIVAVALNGWFGVLGLSHIGGEIALKNVVGRLLLSVMPGSWLSADGMSFGGRRISFGMDDDHVLSTFDPGQVYALTATPGLWIGVVVGVALILGAIWFRQRRIETSV
jgi:ABC-2 type transport system permease protein